MKPWLAAISELEAAGEGYVVVTVASVTGSAPREPGAKMLVTTDGLHTGTIGGGRLEELALDEAKQRLESGETGLRSFPLGAAAGQCCGGSVELLFEATRPGPLLYLFGAGHVGQAVCRVLEGTPFTVHAVDARQEWIEKLPAHVVAHLEEPDEFLLDAPTWDAKRVYAVVMTHRHDVDEALVRELVRKPCKYIGLIGSRAKWQRFQMRLAARGITPEELARVTCPIGIPLGEEAKAPTEVAVSLAAELLRLHHRFEAIVTPLRPVVEDSSPREASEASAAELGN